MMHNAFTVDVEEYFQVHNFEGEVRREDWEKIESRWGIRPGPDGLDVTGLRIR